MQPAHAELLAIARRHARVAHEADDLVQDALLVALEAGRADLSLAANRRWLSGVIRNLARMQARGAARRKARETAHLAEATTGAEADEDRAALFIWVRSLTPSLRGVAALALTGHTRAEIQSALAISDTALRQRLTALKRAAQAGGVRPSVFAALLPALPHGRLRRGLPGPVARRKAAFGTYDPDGNLLIFRTPALTDRRSPATEAQDAGDGAARTVQRTTP